MSMRVYLDSAPVIYLVENAAPYTAILVKRLSAADTFQVCCDLTRLECRVKPMKDNDTVLLGGFDTYFADFVTDIVPLSTQVIDEATKLRARYGFKTPDAIHLAAAIIGKCDLFMTNDHQLQRCKEIAVEVVTSTTT